MGGTVYIRNDDAVIDLTFSVDTAAYASGDLIADAQELPLVATRNNAVVVLKSIVLIDKSDQKVALHLVFLRSNTSLGTENAAPSISDTNSAEVLGAVSISASDYVDLGGAAVATKECSISLETLDTTSLWVGIINSTGTPTYGAASDLIGKFGFLR